RLPMSWEETIEASRLLGAVPPSKRLADALYAVAAVQTVFHTLVRTAADAGRRMQTVGFSERFNADLDAQIGERPGLTYGGPKAWLLHPRLTETNKHTGLPVAINYGAWDDHGVPQQPPEGGHDAKFWDYSQCFQPLQAQATRLSKPDEQVNLL